MYKKMKKIAVVCIFTIVITLIPNLSVKADLKDTFSMPNVIKERFYSQSTNRASGTIEVEQEPNDSRTLADLVKLDGTYMGNLYNNKDVDYYTFDVEKTQDLEFQFIHEPVQDIKKDYWYASIEDSKGNNIGTITLDSDSNICTVAVASLEKGRYYLKIGSIQHSSGNYAFFITKAVNVSSVKLNKTLTTIVKGKSETLKPTINPSNASNQNVKWKSSNTKIATVDSKGVVKGVAAGTATITVTTEDGGKTATCKVTVTQPVTSVKLNKTKLTLSKGKTETLKATVNPSNATNKAVTWKSSNTKVATVDSKGKVKAVAKGTATITVTTKDGSKTVTCKVTVK